MTNTDDKKVLNLNEIERQINFLSNYRGEQRQERLKKTSLNLHNTLKQFGYINVDRNFLLTFFSGLNHTTKFKTMKEILSFLESENKIKPTTKNKICLRLQQKPLYSYMNKKGGCITQSQLSISRTKFKYKVKSYNLN